MSTFPMPLSSFKQFTCVLVSVRQWRHHGDCVSLVNPKTKRCWFVESTKLSFLPCFSSNTQNGKIKYCQLNKYFFPITIAYFEVTVFSIARLYIPRKWISCNLLILCWGFTRCEICMKLIHCSACHIYHLLQDALPSCLVKTLLELVWHAGTTRDT